jgi:hypothetical protein
MSKKPPFRPGDRVTVGSGIHTRVCGEVLRREGVMWVVKLDTGATRQYLASSLHRVTDASGNRHAANAKAVISG